MQPTRDVVEAQVRRERVERGFTLLEVLIVVSLLGIFAAMAVPRVTKPTTDSKLESEANRLGGWLYQSRSLSLGLKRCERIQGYTLLPPASASGVPVLATVGDANLERLKLWEVKTADCETEATIDATAPNSGPITACPVTAAPGTTTAAGCGYVPTVLADFATTIGYTVKITPDTANINPIWRPIGILRGDRDSDLSDDGFLITVTGPPNPSLPAPANVPHTITIRVTTFGEICTGRVSVTGGTNAPTC